MRRAIWRVALCCSLTVAAMSQLPSTAGQAAGPRFRPAGLSQPVYAVDQAVERPALSTSRGTSVYLEVHQPAGTARHPLPARRPTILVATPYAGVTGDVFAKLTTGDANAPVEGDSIAELIDYFVPRGYAVAVTDVVGTGASGGCFDFGGPDEVDGLIAAVRHLGAASWSNGRVGMWGGSYTGGTQFEAATSLLPGSDYLKAITPVAPEPGPYEFMTMGDGVPLGGNGNGGTISYPAAITGVVVGPRTNEVPAGARSVGCSAAASADSANFGLTGDYTAWAAQREWRERIGNVRAATLMTHGFYDSDVYVAATSGSFDGIPATTPKKLVLGQWAHDYGFVGRGDMWHLWHAWFDRYLLGLPTRVEDWPEVQVQDTNGAWREQSDWPNSGGSPGQLALSTDGQLGTPAPQDETTFSEGTAGLASENELPTEPDAAVFRTGVMAAPLHVTGVPVVDLWVKVHTPTRAGDAHVAVLLQAYDAAGESVGAPVYWARSVKHLEPVRRGFFEQPTGHPVGEDTEVHVPVRLMPTDVTVPTGGHLELRIAGTVRPIPSAPYFMSAPSGADATVTILHDCTTHVSALRFLMPDPGSHVLDVEPPTGATAAPRLGPALVGNQDGGGSALGRVCGAAPVDPHEALLQPTP